MQYDTPSKVPKKLQLNHSLKWSYISNTVTWKQPFFEYADVYSLL